MRYAVIALTLVACVKSSSVQCGDVLCSENSVCSPAGDRCVLPSQVDTCAGRDDGAACSYPGVSEGACVQQVCLPAGCGNSLIEPGELCDDGNRVSFDGCSSDCASDERCGNGVVDIAFGEQCDTAANADTPGAMCRTNCLPGRCGDGIVDPGEQCDDGNTRAGDGCRADCAGRWTQMQSPTFASLQRVWASSEMDAWATNSSKIIHWDGSFWKVVPTPNPMLSHQFDEIWGSGPSDVYIADFGATSAVYHWDGTTLAKVNIGGNHAWHAVTGTGANDVWLAGMCDTSASGCVAHWNGSAWTVIHTGIAVALTDIWAASDGAVYVVTFDDYLYHQVGASWVRTLTTQLLRIHTVTGVSPTNVTAFPYHYDGTSWKVLPNSEEMPAANDACANPSETLVVGPAGAIISCTGDTCTIGGIATTLDFYGVWTYVASDQTRRAFIVGNNGAIFY